jgi:hypothetical protein
MHEKLKKELFKKIDEILKKEIKHSFIVKTFKIF